MDRDMERLAELLDGDARLGEDAPELAELAQFASALREVPAASPRAEFRAQLRDRLLLEAAELLPSPAPTSTPREGIRTRVARWRRSVSVALASILSAGALGGVGVAAAAQGAQPDDVLYSVKRATESLRLALAGDRLATGRLHLAYAERRLGEVEVGARELPPDMLVDTLAEMDEQSLTGANLLLDHSESTGDTAALADLARFLRDQDSRLRALIPSLPVQVVPFAEQSLRLVERLTGDTGAAVLPTVDDPPSTVDADDPRGESPPTGGNTEDGAEGVTEGSATSSDPEAGTDDAGPDGEAPIGSLTEGAGGTVGDLLDDPTVEVPDLESPLPTGGATDLLDDTTSTVDDAVDEVVNETLPEPTELPSLGG